MHEKLLKNESHSYSDAFRTFKTLMRYRPVLEKNVQENLIEGLGCQSLQNLFSKADVIGIKTCRHCIIKDKAVSKARQNEKKLTHV